MLSTLTIMPYKDSVPYQDEEGLDDGGDRGGGGGGAVELQPPPSTSSHHHHQNDNNNNNNKNDDERLENDGLFVDRESDLQQHQYHPKKKYSIILWLMLLVMTVVLVIMALSFLKTPTATTKPTQKQSSSSDDKNKNGNNNNSLPEIMSYSYSEELLLCDPNGFVACKTDRWSHDDKLYVGQSLCNDEWRFGVIHLNTSYLASLVWQDCKLRTTYYLQNVTLEQNGWDDETSLAFQMTSDGTFQLYQVSIKNGEEIYYDETDKKHIKEPLLWEQPSEYKLDIQPTERCLSNPNMACPYLHLRKRGGNIVLNFISKDDSSWKARPIKKSYPGLFPESYDP